jgi:hypothetical protein
MLQLQILAKLSQLVADTIEALKDKKLSTKELEKLIQEVQEIKKLAAGLNPEQIKHIAETLIAILKDHPAIVDVIKTSF